MNEHETDTATPPHDAYIAEVVRQLTTRGYRVGEWYADDNDPLDAAITLDDEDGLTLGWTNEKGWYAGHADQHGVVNDARTRYLHRGVVPEAVDVAVWIELLDAGRKPPFSRERSRYRDSDDDDGTREALLAYKDPRRGVVL